MTLPKIDVPVYNLTIPSTGEEIKVRPFTVKEEKLLLMAVESNNMEDVTNQVKQIITNCIITKDVNIDKLPFFDIDYMFIFLRAKSVGEKVEVRMTCNNVLEDSSVCNHMFPAELDIANVDVVKDENVSNDIKLDKTNGVIMKYPNYSIIKRLENTAENDKKTAIIVASIDYIYDKKGTYSSKDYSREDLTKFVEDLTEENYKKLEYFVDNFPVFLAKLDVTCPKCGYDHHVRYSDFYDFFT